MVTRRVTPLAPEQVHSGKSQASARTAGLHGKAGSRSVALLTNVVAPYRAPTYRGLAREFRLTILYSGVEGNREYWGEHDLPPTVRVSRSAGVTLALRRRREGTILDTRYLHLTPGLLLDLLALRPDAVISNEMGFRTIAALLYAGLFRKPAWVWWGGTRHTERNISLARRALRALLTRWVSRWLTYGSSSTEYLVSLQVPRSRIAQLQNCVPEENYRRPTAPTLALEPRPVLLHVGRLIGLKGIDRLLESAARLQRQGQAFSLLLVGDGPDEGGLRQRARALELEHVHFHGAVRPAEMPGIYRSADVLVFPTLGDVWGLVVNEALWSGLRVLASRYAGCAEELLPVENIFDPLDAHDFDEKLVRAVSGHLAPPDLTRLRTAEEVTDMVVRELQSGFREER